MATRWRDAVALIVSTFQEMQRPLTAANYTRCNYTFTTLPREPKDTSAHGIGRAHRWTGMVRTSFLPSDDSPRLPYHIPGNALAVVDGLLFSSRRRACAKYKIEKTRQHSRPRAPGGQGAP